MQINSIQCNSTKSNTIPSNNEASRKSYLYNKSYSANALNFNGNVLKKVSKGFRNILIGIDRKLNGEVPTFRELHDIREIVNTNIKRPLIIYSEGKRVLFLEDRSVIKEFLGSIIRILVYGRKNVVDLHSQSAKIITRFNELPKSEIVKGLPACCNSPEAAAKIRQLTQEQRRRLDEFCRNIKLDPKNDVLYKYFSEFIEQIGNLSDSEMANFKMMQDRANRAGYKTIETFFDTDPRDLFKMAKGDTGRYLEIMAQANRHDDAVALLHHALLNPKMSDSEVAARASYEHLYGHHARNAGGDIQGDIKSFEEWSNGI